MPSPEFDIGIVGSGQLGRMLLHAATRMGLSCCVAGPYAGDPAHQVCPHFTQADLLKDVDALTQFGTQTQRLILEIEHVNPQVLDTWESQNKHVYPSAQLLRLIQNKYEQKKFLSQHGLPVPRFEYLKAGHDLQDKHFPGFLKSCTGGYDGRGVQHLDKPHVKPPFSYPCLWETKVDIQKELAVLACRNAQGQTLIYPIVEMHFHENSNLMHYAVSPAQLSEKTTQEATALAHEVLSALKPVGLLAIEMFLTQKNQLLINEIAPRVHNSGHHTIEACPTSQFEQLLRIAMGYPMGEVRPQHLAATLNWLGEDKPHPHHTRLRYQGLEDALRMRQAYPHRYGKQRLSPHRKMGHVTLLARDYDSLHQKLTRLKDKLLVVGEK